MALIYNKYTFRVEPNPNAKFQYGSICVAQCPREYLRMLPCSQHLLLSSQTCSFLFPSLSPFSKLFGRRHLVRQQLSFA